MDRARGDPGRLLGGVRRSIRCRARSSITRPSGVPADWPHHATGFAAHWNKNTNLAWAFDRWFLNLFPARKPFTAQRRRLRDAQLHPDAGDDDPRPDRRRLAAERRVRWGEGRPGCVARGRDRAWPPGWALASWGVCPIVKRIWTPSWVLFSGGGASCSWPRFYAVIDLHRLRGLDLSRSASSAGTRSPPTAWPT